MSLTTYLYTLPSYSPVSSGEFARWVSISGDGNWLACSNRTINGYAAATGGAYIYTKVGETWTYHSTIPPNVAGLTTGYFFGYSSISLNQTGTLLAIGDNQYSSNTGRIIILSRSGSTWSHHSTVNSPSLGINKYFGQWVSINSDGTKLCTTSSKTFGLYTFTRSGTVWSQEGGVYALPTSGWSSGEYSLSLNSSGNCILVGDCWFDSGGTGRALVLDRVGTTWVLRYSFIAPTPQAYSIFGRGCVLSGLGTYAAVYQEVQDSFEGIAGLVHLYSLGSDEATHLESFTAPVYQSGLWFGWSLAAPADFRRLVAGSLSDNPLSNAGAAYVHTVALEYEPFWTEYIVSDEYDVPYT